MNLTKNPMNPESLIVEELAVGLPIRVVSASGETALKGVVTKLPEYGNDGWGGAKVEVDGEEEPLYIYDNGISCYPNGEWADVYTVESRSL